MLVCWTQYINTSFNKVSTMELQRVNHQLIVEVFPFSGVDINCWIISTNLWLSDYTVITLCLRNLVIWVRSDITLKSTEWNRWGPLRGAWQLKKELNEIRGHIKCCRHWWIRFPQQLQRDSFYFIWGGQEGVQHYTAVSKYKQNLQPTVNLVGFWGYFNDLPCPLHGSQSDY